MAKIDFAGVIKEACMEYLARDQGRRFTPSSTSVSVSVSSTKKEAFETMELLGRSKAVGEEG